MHNALEAAAWIHAGFVAANANAAPAAGTWAGNLFRIGLACATASMREPYSVQSTPVNNVYVVDGNRTCIVAANGTVTLDATVS